jgi:predicted ferric reductase
LVLRLSNQTPASTYGSSTRWDEEYIEKQLSKIPKDQLATVYVCGPPQMNELFNRKLGSMVEAKQLTRE